MNETRRCKTCDKTTSRNCWDCGEPYCKEHLMAKRGNPRWQLCDTCSQLNLLEPLVYRANIKTGEGYQYAFALENRCYGVGWPIDGGSTGMDWENYSALAQRKYKQDRGWKRFRDVLRDLVPGDFIWTRNEQAKFYLGRITSNWRYIADNPHAHADLVNTWGCDWKGPFELDEVPGSLMSCRGLFRPIEDDRLREYTKLRYLKASGLQYTPSQNHQKIDLFKWLSDSACEDLVALYLQCECGYSIIPSTAKHSTPKYEWTMVHRETGCRAAVQVKNGSIQLHCSDYGDADLKVYLFTSGGECTGPCPSNVKVLKREDLEGFALKNRKFTPAPIRLWIDHLYPQ